MDKGNAILVIGHNLGVFHCTDLLIDLGPEGGDKSGAILACGTAEEVAEHPTSHTGRTLLQVLAQHPPQVLTAQGQGKIAGRPWKWLRAGDNKPRPSDKFIMKIKISLQMNSPYYYYEYSPELGRRLHTKIYSDTTVSLLELAQKEGLPPSPLLTAVNPVFRTELSKNYIVTTTVAQDQVSRVIFCGSFRFSGFELTGGTVTDLIVVSKDGTIRGKSYTAPVSYQQLTSIGASKAISDYDGLLITSLGRFAWLFPGGWPDSPFGPDLLSTTTIAADNVLSTTPSIDRLTGVANEKDIFEFSAQSGFGTQADFITRFSAKNKDQIHLSGNAFGVSTGKFAIAKNTRRANRLLASDTSFIYNQKSGELIFNANGTESGSGDAGGVFAVLVGSPSLAVSSLSLI